MTSADEHAWKAFTDLAEVQRRRVLAIARDLDLSPPQMWALRVRGTRLGALSTVTFPEK